MSDYDLDTFYIYTIDKYYYLFNDLLVKTLNNDIYKCHQDYILIEFPYIERMYYKIYKKLSTNMIQQINKIFKLKSEYFFKLSNRSPKDILEKDTELKILDDDHRTIKTEKKIKQLEILKVKKPEDITKLLNLSKRCQEDIDLYNKYPTKRLYFVFAKWRPNLGKSTEYRCFIKKNKLVGICLYKPEYYSTRSIIPVEVIQHFIKQMIQIFKKINLERYVLDCFIYNDDPSKVFFIELNPFEEYIDTFSFNYDDIDKTENLLITL
jgi:hypothetical protein